MTNPRSKLITAVAVLAVGVGGVSLANAASSSSSTSSTTAPPTVTPSAGYGGGGAVNGRHSLNGKTEEPLTGTTAAKVQAAALAKVSGTVDRVETNVDDSAPYEAHITKSDGSEVVVEVNSDFTVAKVQTMGPH
jgi:hypothetical protein